MLNFPSEKLRILAHLPAKKPNQKTNKQENLDNLVDLTNRLIRSADD